MKKFLKFGCLGFIGLIVVIIIIAVATSGGDDTSTDDTSINNSTESKDKSKEDKKGSLTKEKFGKIKEGMSYEEVVNIVGSKGTVISETGEEGTDLHTIMYEFETDGFMSNSNMMFQGGKLINKAQVGLGGGSDVEITLDQFNEIKNGMTLEEVVSIVGGEGEIISESGEKGSSAHTVMYSYTGDKLASSVSLMFQGNKLQNKSQFGLE
ncbi:DUF3862 domain-containing protein [Peribacillus sp. FSL H8-0477]|uniref:DUF3862 domain-containing protein n=1 Tax=Peribacillus sp. FSL H8-0477 TaxID=2921388 RepID=UPI0030F58E0F